jgi:multicomponent Na+:H+ antiporter subunit D
MEALAPWAIGLPLTGAALLPAIGLFGRRRVVEFVALGFGAVSTVVYLLLLSASTRAPFVYWFGDWRPRGDVVIGIAFSVDPLGAGFALLASVLVLGAFLYSWRYFDTVGALFHVLMLALLAGVAGMSLTADLFNLFVFFELCSVVAFGLTGYQTEETGPLQGALNLGVTNGIGGTMVLLGIALLYGRTGALSLSAIASRLEGHSPDSLVVVAFVLLVIGFLVKGAMAPFHFWLPDAYASAPTPVCVVFAGVLSELGLFALARVYWTVFDGPFAAHSTDVTGVLITIGASTAVIGAVLCLAQDRLKRMLAFATMSHAGLFLIGLGLLDPHGTAGASLYIAADGLVKAGLFMAVGIVQHRLAGLDENKLRGRGRELPFVAALFVAGAVGMAGVPPSGTWLGKSMIDEQAKIAGYGWVAALAVVV